MGRKTRKTGREGRKPGSVRTTKARTVIHLGAPLPTPSSDRNPDAFGGPPIVPEGTCIPIRSCSGWGLPCDSRRREPGALLPHHFTLTRACRALYFLWHFPWGRPRWTLSSTPPCGARTFLRSSKTPATVSPSRPGSIVAGFYGGSNLSSPWIGKKRWRSKLRIRPEALDGGRTPGRVAIGPVRLGHGLAWCFARFSGSFASGKPPGAPFAFGMEIALRFFK